MVAVPCCEINPYTSGEPDVIPFMFLVVREIVILFQGKERMGNPEKTEGQVRMGNPKTQKHWAQDTEQI
jgi:hypothetical protein